MAHLSKPTIIVGGKAGALICWDINRNCRFLEVFFDKNKLDKDYFLDGTVDDNIDILKTHDYFIATGDNYLREEITNNLIRKTGQNPVNIIHPRAFVSPSAQLGYGNLILAGAVVHTNSIVGNGCIINTNSVVEHDNVIGDYAQISPAATLCGYVEIGHHSFISANSTLIPSIKVAPNTTIGAGAVVINDILEEYCLYAGVPAALKKIYESKNI